jgi:hypothetical protein
VIEEMIGGQHRINERTRAERVGVNTNQRPTTENYPSNKTAHPRNRTGVLNEKKAKIQTGKNKIKTPLTRPASLEMTHY